MSIVLPTRSFTALATMISIHFRFSKNHGFRHIGYVDNERIELKLNSDGDALQIRVGSIVFTEKEASKRVQ